MPIPLSTVSFSQLRDEVRAGTGSPTAIPGAIPLNDTQIRTYCFNPGPIPALTSRSLGQAQGVTFAQFSIAASTQNYNLRSAMVAAGWPGTDRGIANLTISPGVIVYSPAVSQAALSQGSTPWPGPSSASITVSATARIIGKGGPGGDGGSVGGVGIPTTQWAAGQAGTGGGRALDLSIATTILGPATGQIQGGGGGGGGGNGRRVPSPASSGGGGGGGGGSHPFTAGQGGAGGVVVPGPPYPAGTVARPGQAGQDNITNSGGQGGQNAPQPLPTRAGVGGNGGPLGTAGQAGSSGAATPGVQGPGVGAAGAAGPAIQGYFFATISGSTVTSGPLVP